MRNVGLRRTAIFSVLAILAAACASTAAMAQSARPAGKAAPNRPAAPAATGGAAACTCSSIDALKTEIRNAMALKARHAAMAVTLREKLGDTPTSEQLSAARRQYVEFETGKGPGSAGEGIVAVVKNAPPAINYVPRGQKLQETHARDDRTGIPLAERWTADGRPAPDLELRRKIEAEWKAKGEDLCDHADEAAVKSSATGGATCSGIAAATVAHEAAHQATCRRIGYYAFANRSPADLAEDEVRAYDKQIEMLGAELRRVLGLKQTRIRNKPLGSGIEGLLAADAGCAVAVSVRGQIDELILTGQVCDIAEQAKLKGNYPIDFQLTPQGESNGTYAYSGRAAGSHFYGSGNYRYELTDGSGTLLLDGAGRWYVRHPMGTASKGGPERLKATGMPNGCS